MFSFTPLLATANIIPRPIMMTIPTPVQKAPMDSRTPVFQRAARIPPMRITKPNRYKAVHFIKAPPQSSTLMSYSMTGFSMTPWGTGVFHLEFENIQDYSEDLMRSHLHAP